MEERKPRPFIVFDRRFQLAALAICVTIYIYCYKDVYSFATQLATFGNRSTHKERNSRRKFNVSAIDSNFIPKYINDSQTSILVYSAYKDSRIVNTVRVLGIGRIRPKPKLFCHWMTKERKINGKATAAQISFLFVDEVLYDGLYIDCPLPSNIRPSFVGVSLSSKLSQRMQVLPVTDIPSSTPNDTSIAACVPPMFGDKFDERNLIAWIEMNRLLGVQHFVFYNYSAPTRLVPLFRYYSEENVTELLNWDMRPFPISLKGGWPPSKDKIHYCGQYPANNECLHRLMNRYRFAMFTDLDELLMPSKRNQTLAALLKRADNNGINCFLFRNCYVRPDFKEEKDWQGVKFLRQATREKRIFPSGDIPKIIVKPHLVIRVGVHKVLTRISGHLKVFHPDNALLFHFRDPPKHVRLKNDFGKRDERVLMFKRQLLVNIERTEKMIAEYKDKR